MKSIYSNRDTIGTTYLEAQKNDATGILIGDVAHELATSLVEDLNDTIKSNPFEGRPFYIIIHESKDMQMQKCIRRRMIVKEKRPWPEDDTVVFWTHPGENRTLFCWCLPHWSEMDNILMNIGLYDSELVREVKAWKSFDLHHFGFMKDEIGNWVPNPHFKDKPLEKPQVIIKPY